MEFAGYVIGEGNRPGEVVEDLRAMEEARHLNQVIQTLIQSPASS